MRSSQLEAPRLDRVSEKSGDVRGQPNRVVTLMIGGLMMVAFLILLALVLMSPRRLVYDEVYFADYAALLKQHGFTTTFLRSLDAAPGPLCALVQVVFEPATGLRPIGMRLVNVLLLAIVGLVLMMRFKKQGHPYWVAGLPVLAVPMTWVIAGLALSEMSAILFVTFSLCLQLMGLDALANGGPVRRLFAAGAFCLGIAVWGRQPYLLLTGVPIVLTLIDRRLRMASVIFVAVVLAMVAPLFMIWKGVLPPSQHSVQQGFSATHGLVSLAYTGACFFLLSPGSFRLPARVLFVVAPLTVAANAFLGKFVLYPVRSFVEHNLATSVMPAFGVVCGSLFLSVGVLFLALLLRSIWKDRMDLRWVTVNAGLLCVAVSPMFIAHQYSSRYSAMALPYLVLAAQRSPRWTIGTGITAVVGCGIGFLSLIGYFFR